MLEASAALLGLESAVDERAVTLRQKSLAILRQGQARDGGWGPYTTAPSESFDTAVAILALLAFRENPALAAPTMTEAEWRTAIDRGRTYLLSQQNDDGSWVETTRPTGQESYSQRISTTAWALIAALLSPIGRVRSDWTRCSHSIALRVRSSSGLPVIGVTSSRY